MPNWCMNSLEITCDDQEQLKEMVERLLALEEDAYGEVHGLLKALDPTWRQREAAGATFNIEDGVITADFETPWSPPTDLYDDLSDEGFEVYASYYEPGMQIAGIHRNGFDTHVEYSEVDEDFWKDGLGKELDETWDITSNFWDEDDD